MRLATLVGWQGLELRRVAKCYRAHGSQQRENAYTAKQSVVHSLETETQLLAGTEQDMSFDEQPDGDLHGECAAEIAKLTKERDHWKANHANMVKRSRVLIERTDMPLERVKAFEQIGELQQALQREERLAPVMYINAKGALVARVSFEQVEAVLGPIVDHLRIMLARIQNSPAVRGGAK